MPFPDTLTLKDAAGVDQVFTLQGRDRNGSDFLENDAVSTLQRRVLIRHSNAGASVQKGAKPVRRHLAQFILDKWNSTLGKTERMTVNVTITNDPGSSLVLNDMLDLANFAKNFIVASGYVEKLSRDET